MTTERRSTISQEGWSSGGARTHRCLGACAFTTMALSSAAETTRERKMRVPTHTHTAPHRPTSAHARGTTETLVKTGRTEEERTRQEREGGRE